VGPGRENERGGKGVRGQRARGVGDECRRGRVRGVGADGACERRTLAMASGARGANAVAEISLLASGRRERGVRRGRMVMVACLVPERWRGSGPLGLVVAGVCALVARWRGFVWCRLCVK